MHSENEFYQRQTKLSFMGLHGQERLKAARVLIIGAGGLGHPVATYLAGTGIGTIGILDFDLVSFSNLHRQVFFTPNDINQKKVDILANAIKRQNPFITIIPIHAHLNANNIEEILTAYDNIVDCCDSLETKFLIHDVCKKLQKNLTQGSIDQIEGEIKNFNFTSIDQGPCLRCLWPVIPDNDCVLSCAEAGVLPTTAGIFGTLMANEVVKTIIDYHPLLNGQSFIFNLATLEARKIKWKKNLVCPLCFGEISSERPVFEIERSAILDLKQFTIINLAETTPTVDQLDKNKKYLLVCHLGVTSLRMTKLFRQVGVSNVWSLCGGIKCL